MQQTMASVLILVLVTLPFVVSVDDGHTQRTGQRLRSGSASKAKGAFDAVHEQVSAEDSGDDNDDDDDEGNDAGVKQVVVTNKVAGMARKQPALTPPLRGFGANVTALHATHSNSTHHTMSEMPCQCQLSSTSWTECERTVPKCVFIDLGAADGNSFRSFLDNSFGPVANCNQGQWEAILVEANPRFDVPLQALQTQNPGGVVAKTSSAAYMCEATTSFYLDTTSTEHNYWGSSMSTDHPDVQKSGQKKVTVPTLNLNRILYENTIWSDWVIVKMDIEGSEWDVLPCLSESSAASLVDVLFMETHPATWGMAGTTPAAMEAVKTKLRNLGVKVPTYNSETL